MDNGIDFKQLSPEQRRLWLQKTATSGRPLSEEEKQFLDAARNARPEMDNPDIAPSKPDPEAEVTQRMNENIGGILGMSDTPAARAAREAAVWERIKEQQRQEALAAAGEDPVAKRQEEERQAVMRMKMDALKAIQNQRR